MNGSMIWLVGSGGAMGAMARYGVGRWLSVRGARNTMATLLVNLAGSLAAGMLFGMQLQRVEPELFALLGTGFLGGLTTYSTLNVQKALLADEGAGRPLARYAGFTYLGGWIFTAAGIVLGHSVRIVT